jgi:hypothetical protein
MVSGRRWRRIDIDINGWVVVDFQVRYWLSPGRRRAACLRRLFMCSAAGVALGIALGIPVVFIACLGDDTVDVVVRGQQSAQGFGLQWASTRGDSRTAKLRDGNSLRSSSHSCLGGRNALAAGGFHDLCLTTNMCLSLYNARLPQRLHMHVTYMDLLLQHMYAYVSTRM